MENIESVISKIQKLLKEAQFNSDNSAAGYDEGWYNGEVNAYEKVLNLLKEQAK